MLQGRTPNTWLWTVLAVSAFAWALIALVIAAIAPAGWAPRVFRSYHVEHFAAFYTVTILAAAGLPRIRLLTISLAIVIVAAVLMAVRLTTPTHQSAAVEDFVIDVAGVLAAVAPILVGRFRRISGEDTSPK